MDTHKVIYYYLEDDNPITNYVFSYVFEIVGLKAEQVKYYNRNIHVYYGNSLDNLDGYSGIYIKRNSSDIIWRDLIDSGKYDKISKKVLDFDIINAIRFFLADVCNKNLKDEAFDTMDRLTLKHSFQYNNGIHKIPIVNIYIDFFKQLLIETFHFTPMPLWPENKKSVIVLSHDVDVPDKFPQIRNLLFFPRKHIIKYYLHLIVQVLKRYVLNRKNDYWLFEQIIDKEKSMGFKSTFFFTVINKYSKYGGGADTNYIIDNSKFHSIFNKIKNNDFEIGLHNSYNALNSKENYISEKKKLESVANTSILGQRHHSWHMGRDLLKTVRLQEMSGVKYDSSIAFNENMGFRNNIALPYRLFDEENNREIPVTQIPTFCMDGHIIYNYDNFEDGMKEALSFINTINDQNGISSLNWHVRTSFPNNNEFHKIGEIYIKILDKLSEREDVWVTNFEEVISWLEKRKETINNNKC